MLRLMAAMGCGLFFASVAAAQTPRLIALESGSRSIYELDLTSGARTLLGVVSANVATAGGLAYDCASQTLYLSSTTNDSLYRVDMTTWQATLVGPYGADVVMHGLEWDNSTGTLYGASNAPGGDIYTINTTTGAATLVGGAGLGTATGFVNLVYDPLSDTMFGTYTSTDSFYSINRATGAATLIGPLWGDDNNPHGLAFNHLNGQVYLIDAASDTLYTIDVVTGVATAIGLPGAGNYLGLAFIAPCPVIAGAELRISVGDGPDPLVVPPGGDITYTVNVRNLGPDTATDVVVTDVLPTNATFVSVSAPGVHNAGTVTASLGTLTPGQEVSFQIVMTPNGIENVTNTATVTTTANDTRSGNNTATATTIVRPPNADLDTLITSPADCTVPPGGTASYSIRVRNQGPEAAENSELNVSIPANVTFDSSIPAGSVIGNTLTVNLGSIAPGTNTVVTVNFTINSGPTVELSAFAATSTVDIVPGDNGDTDQFLVPGAAPTTASIRALFSTYAPSTSSDVPGQPGIKYSLPERPFLSPDGTRWVMNVDTTAATGSDDLILSGFIGGPYNIIAQEGVTTLPQGDVLQVIPSAMGINDSGHVAFNADTNAATSGDEVVVKWDGTGFTTVAREGQPAPAFGAGVNYGSAMDSVSIQNDGTVSFFTSLTGLTTQTDNAYLTDNGSTLLVQEGVTIPTGQANGTSAAADTFATGTTATEGAGLFLNSTGSSFSAIHELVGVATAEDKVLVVDNDVKIQEGHIIPGSGFGSPVASASPVTNFMAPSGRWYSTGSNADSQDWVVRNGAVIARTGDPLFPGSDKLWGDTSFAATFFMVAENAAGDYVIGGVFSGGDATTKTNSALVLNGTTIIARENDPIDLDANGVFDDGVYLRTFVDDRVVMTNEAVYAVVRLRSAADANCGTTDTDQGYAFVRIPISTGPTACNAADIATAGNPDPNAGPDGFLTGDDFDLFINAFFNELTRTNGSLIADLVDGDGNLPPDGFLTGSDFDYFLAKFFAGC